MADVSETPEPTAAAPIVFGAQLPKAVEYARLLAREGVLRGLIGPREVDRLWHRHLLNCAVVGELIEHDRRVVDVGSGAGLPGIPLAIARPDLHLTLLEPMERRIDWLTEVVGELDLDNVRIERGRAEERRVRDKLGEYDVVIARAVAPIDRLARWCVPLLRPFGHLLAIKGATAERELAEAASAIRRLTTREASVMLCGEYVLDVPTTVIRIERASARSRHGRQTR